MKMRQEAIKEIMKILERVQEVKELAHEMGISYSSDSWSAVTPPNHNCEYEDILNWSEEDFARININEINYFNIGGNVITCRHQYNNEWINEPKELAKAKANMILYYLKNIIELFTSKYFELSLDNHYELCDNDGWEQYVGIKAIPIKSKCIKENTFEILGCFSTKIKAANYDDALEKINLMQIIDMDSIDIDIDILKD